MFGYIRPLKGEMKIREWELYKSAYCGLCHALKKQCGFFSRFMVNYDFTFLVLLFWAISDENPSIIKKRCIASPLVKKCVCAESKVMDFAADASAILFYWKLLDEVGDSEGFKRLGAKIAAKILERAYKKASIRLPVFSSFTAEKLKQLREIENSAVDSIDAAADKFAQILGSLSEEIEDLNKKRIVSQILYHIGRYIYIVDAWDDLADDLKNKTYNPIALRYKIIALPVSGAIESEIKETIAHSINAIRMAYELIDTSATDGIIRNIISLGLPAVVNLVSKGEFNKKEKQ